jgi:ATF/CREB family transcription factor
VSPGTAKRVSQTPRRHHIRDIVLTLSSEKQLPSIKQPDSDDGKEGVTANAPLAPPPKPNQSGDNNNDYFSAGSKPTHFSSEPNPFENAFGSNPSDTPGKPQLPGVTSLTSPASLLPSVTPGWPGSLRSGPLSPAMLTGPTSNNDYFSSDHHFSGSFPTPNESSLRTGLTPGGGGSMFPQPSPNSQALYNSLQSGGATPGTLDFHRTAMTARAHSQANSNFSMPNSTSQPQQNPNIQPDLDSKPYNPNGQSQQQDNQDPFSSHQTNDAANGLFMLAQAGGQQQQQRNGQQNFGMPPQQQQPHHQQSYHGMPQEQGIDGRAGKNSVGSNLSGDTENGPGDYSDVGSETKPQARAARGKKGSAGKGAANGKRKTEETPSKPVSKRQRTNNSMGGMSNMDMEMDEDEEEIDENAMDDSHPDGKKMTDEEKRKNFLERNRVAALKCRQRKKQWLANLQQKVEIFSTENDALAATVTQLREEIVGLKTLLLAHKDCPVSAAQGISAQAIQQIAGNNNDHQYANPYGMMGHGMQGQMQSQMQRR